MKNGKEVGGRHSTKPLEVLKDENLSSGAFYFFLLTLLILRIFVCTKELWQVEEKCLNSDKTCTSELTLSMGLSWCGYAGIFLKIHWMKSIWLLDSEYQYKTILPGPWNKFWCLHFPQRCLLFFAPKWLLYLELIICILKVGGDEILRDVYVLQM